MNLVRLALTIDTVGGLASGALLALGSSFLAPLTGVPTSVSMPLGLFLLALGGFIGWTAMQRETSRGRVLLIVAINAIWTIGSVIVLMTNALPLTSFGVGFIIVQAVVVATLGTAQWVGLGRSRTYA